MSALMKECSRQHRRCYCVRSRRNPGRGAVLSYRQSLLSRLLLVRQRALELKSSPHSAHGTTCRNSPRRERGIKGCCHTREPCSQPSRRRLG